MGWTSRSIEERNLINPSFVSVLFWHAAHEYRRNSMPSSSGMPLDLMYLLLPIVLHQETRETLPLNARTSIPVWLDRKPLLRTHIAQRAQELAPHTRDGLMFGGRHGCLAFESTSAVANLAWSQRMRSALNLSGDVSECTKKSAFVGKWFGGINDSATIFGIMGVDP